MADATLDDSAELLLDFAQAMHRVQLPADKIEDYLAAIAKRLGVTSDVLMLQSFLAADVHNRGGYHVALRRIPFDAHWRLARVRAVVNLANACARGAYSVVETRARLREIVTLHPDRPRGLVVAAYLVYGATVAARLGGRGTEMIVAALVALMPAFFHYVSIGRRTVDLQKTFLASVGASAIVLGCTLVFPPFDGPRALFGGLTLLVPAAALAIATHELANDALESGTPRLAYALLRFAMLGAGIAATLKLWLLFAPMPVIQTATPLPPLAILAILVVGSVSLVICLQGRRSDAPWIMLGVVVAFGTQALTKQLFGEDGAPFVAAFMLGIAGSIYARFARDGVPATVIIPGLLQIAPGFLGTQAVFALLRGEAGGHTTFFHVFLVAIQLVIGLVLASVLFAPRRVTIESWEPPPSATSKRGSTP